MMSYIGSSNFTFYERQMELNLDKLEDTLQRIETELTKVNNRLTIIETKLDKMKVPSVSNSTLYL